LPKFGRSELEAARAASAFAGRWISGGKWLLRELREFDPAFAASWLAARDFFTRFAGNVAARLHLRAFAHPIEDGDR
jgi:hypothetical protein